MAIPGGGTCYFLTFAVASLFLWNMAIRMKENQLRTSAERSIVVMMLPSGA